MDTSRTSRPVLCVQAIRKTYGPTVAVSDISFEVCEGEIFGLTGPAPPAGADREDDDQRSDIAETSS